MPGTLPQKTEPLENASLPGAKILLLVVDPHSSDYEPITQHPSARVVSTDSVKAALQLLAQTSFDLCVVNLSLQNSDGASLLWQIQATQPGIPIVAVADSYDSRLEQAAWRYGATAFVAKPEHQPWLNRWLEENSIKRQPPRLPSNKAKGRQTEQLVPI